VANSRPGSLPTWTEAYAPVGEEGVIGVEVCAVIARRLSAGLVGQQPDRHLRLKPTFHRESRFAQVIGLFGLEVEGRDIEQHERGRAK